MEFCVDGIPYRRNSVLTEFRVDGILFRRGNFVSTEFRGHPGVHLVEKKRVFTVNICLFFFSKMH
jgi:hypothetical protein